MPVCSGSFTGWRSTTPGAMRSSGLNSSAAIGPLPSMRLAERRRPRGRPAPRPTGTEMIRPVRSTSSPSLMVVVSPRSTTPTLSSSRLRARPKTSCGNCEQLAGHARRRGRRRGRCRRPTRHHGAHLGHVDGGLEPCDLAAQDVGDLVNFDLHAFVLLAAAPPRREAAELCLDGTVADPAADPDHEAGQQRRDGPRLRARPGVPSRRVMAALRAATCDGSRAAGTSTRPRCSPPCGRSGRGSTSTTSGRNRSRTCSVMTQRAGAVVSGRRPSCLARSR